MAALSSLDIDFVMNDLHRMVEPVVHCGVIVASLDVVVVQCLHDFSKGVANQGLGILVQVEVGFRWWVHLVHWAVRVFCV